MTQFGLVGTSQLWNYLNGKGGAPSYYGFTFDSDTSNTAAAGSNTQKFSVGFLPVTSLPSVSSGGLVYFETSVIGWANQYNSLQYRCGFTSNANYPFVNWSTAGATIQASSPYSLNRTTCIYIQASTLGNDSLTDNDYTDIIAVVPVPALSSFNSFGSSIIFQQQNSESRLKNFMPQFVKTISIKLLDDQFMPLGLPDNAICNFEIALGYNGENNNS